MVAAQPRCVGATRRVALAPGDVKKLGYSAAYSLIRDGVSSPVHLYGHEVPRSAGCPYDFDEG